MYKSFVLAVHIGIILYFGLILGARSSAKASAVCHDFNKPGRHGLVVMVDSECDSYVALEYVTEASGHVWCRAYKSVVLVVDTS